MGYAPDESLTLDEMLRGKYSGIRPAFGYPSLIDHSEKSTFFEMLDVTNRIGMTLSENYMMVPGGHLLVVCILPTQIVSTLIYTI